MWAACQRDTLLHRMLQVVPPAGQAERMATLQRVLIHHVLESDLTRALGPCNELNSTELQATTLAVVKVFDWLRDSSCHSYS
jgi:hypothetical protein